MKRFTNIILENLPNYKKLPLEPRANQEKRERKKAAYLLSKEKISGFYRHF